jgi:hypothetical protein
VRVESVLKKVNCRDSIDQWKCVGLKVKDGEVRDERYLRVMVKASIFRSLEVQGGEAECFDLLPCKQTCGLDYVMRS